MSCVRFAMYLSCILLICSAVAAEAQESELPRSIGAKQPDLLAEASVLLGARVGGGTLFESRDAMAWIQTGELPSYQTMNRRAVRLRACSVYFYQAGSTLPDDAIWRERLSNHGIRLIEVPDNVSNAGLLFLSDELCHLFPEKRETIQKNLYEELERRRSRRVEVNLALHHPE